MASAASRPEASLNEAERCNMLPLWLAWCVHSPPKRTASKGTEGNGHHRGMCLAPPLSLLN